MSESRLRQYLIKGLRSHGEITAIENPLHPGTPDIFCQIAGISSWIEAKFVREYPKRPATPVRVDHFTPAQRHWLGAHQRAGGKGIVILKVDRDFYLFPGSNIEQIGNLTKNDLRVEALFWWFRSVNFSELAANLGRWDI